MHIPSPPLQGIAVGIQKPQLSCHKGPDILRRLFLKPEKGSFLFCFIGSGSDGRIKCPVIFRGNIELAQAEIYAFLKLVIRYIGTAVKDQRHLYRAADRPDPVKIQPGGDGICILT